LINENVYNLQKTRGKNRYLKREFDGNNIIACTHTYTSSFKTNFEANLKITLRENTYVY